MDVGNLISSSSVFSKSSLNIWKFSLHVLLRPGLKDFEHYFASVWDEYNCVVVWTFLSIAFRWDWNENWLFPILWPLLSFQVCWHIEHSNFTLYMGHVTSIHDYWKNHSFYWMDLCGKVTFLLFNMLFRFVIHSFFSRSKCLIISWLTVPIFSDFGGQEKKVCYCF